VKHRFLHQISTAKTMAKYDDYDWNELPADAKAAAEKLGYNKKIWDKGGTTKYEEYDWDELEADLQAAAKVLGYDKKAWDE